MNNVIVVINKILFMSFICTKYEWSVYKFYFVYA